MPSPVQPRVQAHPPIERNVVRPRARCMDCFYVIEGLDAARCPECGRLFDLNDPATYTTRPPFLWWTFWLPGFLIAAATGAVSMMFLVLMGAWGWALWLAAPLAAAALLGYRVRVGLIGLILVGMLLASPLIGAVVFMGAAGAFCGMILAAIFIFPIMCGLGLGAAMRMSLKNSNFSQREYLPILLAMLVPMLCGLIEKQTTPAAQIERISTSREFDAPVDALWQSMMFYEEVEHEPPLLLRIGLAHPLYTVGSSREVGDVKTCIYNKGRITKRVTEVDRHRLLAFVVTEQAIGYERDVRLRGGEFAFEAIDEGRTRVTLSTEYEPLLTPRFAWRWGERIAVHTLHEHVLEGMAMKSQQHTGRALAMRGELQ